MIDEYIYNISKFVSEHDELKIQNISSKINKIALREIHNKMDGRKAKGIDNVSKTEYEENLDSNIDVLVDKLKRDSYNPKPSKRVYIEKFGDRNKKRPLGISCYEDKLVESVVARLLSAIYEPKFMEFSYGFRPNRSCHKAIRELKKIIMTQKSNYVVEADIKSFFDTIDHEWMIRFLEHDIGDKKLIRLIRKSLKTGILENGRQLQKEEGTPQGNAMSPVLANVYLHYVIDLWFEKIVKRRSRGEAYIIRYADDFVCVFQYEDDAILFKKELTDRLRIFGLDVAPDKTRLLEFGRYAIERRKVRGEGKPETFNFLGLTFCCGKEKFGNRFNVILRTDRKRFSEKLRKLKVWLYDNRTLSIKDIIARINKSLIGHYNYYGVSTNIYSLNLFKFNIGKAIFKMLNRRGQRRSYNWRTFNSKVLQRFPLVTPRIHVQV